MQGKLPEKWGGELAEATCVAVNSDGSLTLKANKGFAHTISQSYGSASNVAYYYTTKDLVLTMNSGEQNVSTVKYYYPNREDGKSYAVTGTSCTAEFQSNYSEISYNGFEGMTEEQINNAIVENNYKMDLYAAVQSTTYGYSKTYNYIRFWVNIPGTAHSWASFSSSGGSDVCLLGTVTVNPNDINKIVKFEKNENWVEEDSWIGKE